MMAMGFKMPVVITDVFYEKKWVSGRAGLIAHVGNSSDLAEKLKHLLRNKQLAINYGNAGYDYSSRVFNWQKIAEQYYQVYKRLVQ